MSQNLQQRKLSIKWKRVVRWVISYTISKDVAMTHYVWGTVAAQCLPGIVLSRSSR